MLETTPPLLFPSPEVLSRLAVLWVLPAPGAHAGPLQGQRGHQHPPRYRHRLPARGATHTTASGVRDGALRSADTGRGLPDDAEAADDGELPRPRARGRGVGALALGAWASTRGPHRPRDGRVDAILIVWLAEAAGRHDVRWFSFGQIAAAASPSPCSGSPHSFLSRGGTLLAAEARPALGRAAARDPLDGAPRDRGHVPSQTWAQAKMSATHAAIVFALEPVFTAIFAAVFLGERLSRRDWTGAALVLLGITSPNCRSRGDSAASPDRTRRVGVRAARAARGRRTG